MSDQTKLIIAIALVALGITWPKLKGMIDLPETPSVPLAVNVDFEAVNEPSEDMKSLVAGLSDLVTGEDAQYDKIRLAQFYAQLSKVVANEPGFIETTGQFREYNSMVGQINFAGKSLKGKYNGLGKAVDDAIVDAIGKENIALSDEKRQDLSDVLAAVSWELWHE